MPPIPRGWRAIADSLQTCEGMPWEFSLAIGIHESGWGTSPPVKSHCNPFGIKRGDHFEYFHSLTEAFEALAYRFSGRHTSYMHARAAYVAASAGQRDGLTREFLDAFGRVYCPDETKAWVDDVEKIVRQLRATERPA